MSYDSRQRNDEYRDGLSSPGPYIARIVNNLDPMKQGSLEVELLRNVGNQDSANQQLYVVRYLSPFYGTTDVELNGNDPKSFNDTQKSYGFWFVPPDTGSLVMVIFVDSDPGQGYWMGCIQDAYMNHMIPGLAASKAFADQHQENNETEWKSPTATTDRYPDAKVLPVGEFNRFAIRSGALTVNPSIDDITKPLHPMAEVLLNQGTIYDPTRGTTTSSARREAPSSVFGISTPGPVDKRTNAKKGSIGRQDNKITKFISRLGGHQLVMDDGNDRRLRKTKPSEGPIEYADLENGETGLVEYPEDECFRLRTRTGHQILMHNSEDLIYICNSGGTAWMEFTSNGKIDIYCEDSISIHSEQDFNFVADRDISLHAGRSLNLYAGTRINSHSEDHTSIKSGVGISMKSETTTHVDSPDGMHFNSKTLSLNLEEIKLTANTIDILAGTNLHMSAKSGNVEIKSGTNTMITSGSLTHLLSGGATRITASAIQATASGSILVKGGTIGVKASNDLQLKGANIHLNGPVPPDPTTAEQAVEATPAPAQAVTTPPTAAGGAGGGGGSGQAGGATGGALTLFPNPKAGLTIVKRVPTAEPWPYHENKNPPGQIPDLTDRETIEMPYAKDEPQITIRSTDDSLATPTARGGTVDEGNPGGLTPGVNIQGNRLRQRRDDSGSNTDPNQAVSNPLSERQLANMPSDWVQDKEFLAKAQTLAGKYGMPLEEFLAFMWFESAHTMSPSKTNSLGYTGLSQIGKKACKQMSSTYGKNITTDMLRQMSRVEQLDWVEKYLDMAAKQGGVSPPLTIGTLYMLVALPAYAKKPDNAVLYPIGSDIWSANPAWRDPYGGRDGGGPVTPAGIKRNVGPRSIAAVKQLLAKGGAAGAGGDNTAAPPVTPSPPPTPTPPTPN